MTWLSNLLEPTELRSPENPAVPLTSATLIDLMTGPPSAAGVHVTEKKALGLPAVYRAISLLADGAAGLPLHGYRDVDDDRRERMKPQPRILRQPHPDLTTFEWVELIYVHLLGWGNAYLWKLRDRDGIVRELWPIEPSRVKPGRAKDGSKVYRVDIQLGTEPDADREYTALTDNEMLHIPGMGYDGVAGMSPIQIARQAFGLAMAAERFGARLFGSGNLLSGILSTDQKLTSDQADMVKQRWKAQHSGENAAFDIGVLGGGVKYQPVSVPPADAQFIESRRFQVSEIARIFGVPPHLLMDTEKSTSWGTGIEQQSIGFVVYTLRPWLIRVEQRLSRLLPSPQYVKFTVEGLLRGDTKSRFESYAIGRNWGWLSVNDIRKLEDLPPVTDGDGYMQPLNMTTLGAEPEPPAPADPPVDDDEEVPADA